MHVCFVCSGNICRSPMSALVFRDFLHRAGLSERVEVSSAGTGSWHVGGYADPRAIQTLVRNGYSGTHRAAALDSHHLQADLLVALDSGHYRELQRRLDQPGQDRGKVRLLRSFDPAAGANLDVPDPYYGKDSGFSEVLQQIEQAMPGLVSWVRAEMSLRPVTDNPLR